MQYFEAGDGILGYFAASYLLCGVLHKTNYLSIMPLLWNALKTAAGIWLPNAV